MARAGGHGAAPGTAEAAPGARREGDRQKSDDETATWFFIAS